MTLRRYLILPLGFLLFLALSCGETKSSGTEDIGVTPAASPPIVEHVRQLASLDISRRRPTTRNVEIRDAARPAPRVGVNGFSEVTVQQFAGLLRLVGAKVRHLDPGSLSDPDKQAERLLDGVDCLLLTGGADIDPAAYGEERHETVSLITEKRQKLDFALILAARRRKMPMLGICLGGQEMNVALGGSLVQDIPSEIGTSTNHRDLHTIETVPGTLMANYYGMSPALIYSNHHQAVDPLDLGEGLRISAISPDGVVEAIEGTDQTTFMVGVQYHPEMQGNQTLHKPLWQAFADACSNYRDRNLQQ